MSTSIPCSAFLEYGPSNDPRDQRIIRRIVLNISHPEHFMRVRGADESGAMQKHIAVQERLLDTALVWLYDGTILPSFLSSARYFRHRTTVMTISLEDFEDPATGALSSASSCALPLTNQLNQCMDRHARLLSKRLRTQILGISKASRLSTLAFRTYVASGAFTARHGGRAEPLRARIASLFAAAIVQRQTAKKRRIAADPQYMAKQAKKRREDYHPGKAAALAKSAKGTQQITSLLS